MAQTGRPSFEAVEASTYGVPSGRIRPPPDLGPREKAAFLALILACPAEQFRPCDVELLTRWSEASVTAKEARIQLALSGMVDGDGKPSPWVAIYQQALKNQTLLALRLRIGPQSRAPRAPKVSARKLSYYEQQALEETEANGQGEEDAPTRAQ